MQIPVSSLLKSATFDRKTLEELIHLSSTLTGEITDRFDRHYHEKQINELRSSSMDLHRELSELDITIKLFIRNQALSLVYIFGFCI